MKPILFNTDMVRAILEGRKTVTRRVIKPFAMGLTYEDGSPARKPPYQPGDVLYVRETWAMQQGLYWHKAGLKINWDGRAYGVVPPEKWKPSIHMPREAARIFLRVTDVRVERLQDVTVDGALKEGTPDIEPPPICRKEVTYPEGFPRGFDRWDKERQEEWIKSEARARYIGWMEYANNILRAFEKLWDSIIKPVDRTLYGWAANPWVWVIEFEQIGREEAQHD